MLEKKRLQRQYDDSEIISRRAYNGILCGLLLYGLVINVILCALIPDIAKIMSMRSFLIIYFVCAISGTAMSAFSDNPIVSCIGYNLVVVPIGLVISMCIKEYGGLTSDIVVEAFLITCCITFTMTAFAFIKPAWCSKLGNFLLPGLLGLILAEIVMLIFGISNILTSWAAAIIFSLYITYDVYRSQQFEPTLDNAIDCALDIYLDIANLFLRILSIFWKKSE